jgi:ribosomal protein S25
LEAVAAEEMPAKKKEKDRAKAEAQAAYTIDEEVEEND